jgi:hypothetical protein
MAIVPNFATSQTIGLPGTINFQDTSTGTNTESIVNRRVYMRTSANEYLVTEGNTSNYENWGITSAGTLDPLTISFDVLNKDYALYIRVEWWTLTEVVHSVEYLQGFTLYNESFDYQLTQMLSGNPLLINDNNFYPNKSKLRVNIDSGNQAIFNGADIFAAQQCFDRATNLRLNSPYFYNANV